MKINKWVIGGGLILGLALWAASAAAEEPEDKPDPSGSGMKVRNGFAHDGCEHFELQDQDALRAWMKANWLSFASWLGKVAEVKANPEPLLLVVLERLFPECSWPPPSSTTFGPQRSSWDEFVEAVKQEIGGLELSAGPGQHGSQELVALEVLMGLAMRHMGGAG